MREEDRRSFALEPAPDGQEMQAAMSRRDLANMRLVLAALPEECRPDFVRMLGRAAGATRQAP